MPRRFSPSSSARTTRASPASCWPSSRHVLQRLHRRQDILQVLFVSILFGIALALLGEKGAKLQDALKTLTAIIFRIVHILMYAAPIGAFGAMAFTIGKYGIGSLINLAALVGTFYATSILFVIVVLGLIARAAGFSLWGLVEYSRTSSFSSWAPPRRKAPCRA